MSEAKYLVQYEDPNGTWRNVNAVQYDVYGEALDKLIEEVQADSNFNHRIVLLEVITYIKKGGY